MRTSIPHTSLDNKISHVQVYITRWCTYLACIILTRVSDIKWMDILKHTHHWGYAQRTNKHTYTRTHRNAWRSSYIHTYVRTYIRMCMPTLTHTKAYTRTPIHRNSHTRHTKAHTQVLSYSSVSMCTYVHTYVHTNVRLIDSAYLHAPHTHRHTHACTHLMIDVCFTMMSIVSFPSTIGICTVSFQVGVFDFLAD